MRPYLIFINLVLCCNYLVAQHDFSGYIDNDQWQNDVYLSVIENYRTVSGIYEEQIISKVNTDSSGYFQFRGNQLEIENKIYKLHVDNCDYYNQSTNHFEGHCENSKDILFIAKSSDTIRFPFSFNKQMFCSITSTNSKTSAFIKIDSLKEEMKFAYSEFRSEVNRKLNNKKWFKTLQDFGKSLNEPLAELYIYSFLSNRSNNFHSYYLEDLKANPYYDELLIRLIKKYPKSTYTKQYKTELKADKFMISEEDIDTFNWIYLICFIVFLPLISVLIFWYSRKKRQSKTLSEIKKSLTKQEQKILNLLLEDKTNKEIAETLFVSLSTVKTHVNNTYKKLNVQSREEIKALFIK